MRGRIARFTGTPSSLAGSRVLDLDLSGLPGGPYAFPSAPQIVNPAGQIHLELTFTSTADMATQVAAAAGDFYFLSGDMAASGDTYIKFASADSSLRFGVRGADRITIPAYPTLTNEYPSWTSGRQVKVRAWYDQNSGRAGMYWVVQGVAYQPVTATVATPPTLSQLSNLWIGSNRGSGVGAFSSFQSTRLTTFAGIDPGQRPEGQIVILGDSNTACLGPYTSLWRESWAHALLSTGQIAKNPIVNLAVPGGTITSNQTTWDNSPYKGRGDVRAVMIMIGVNDASNGDSAATMEGHLTTLFSDIHASAPNAKIIGVAYFPELQHIGSTDWAALSALNGALSACGADVVINGQVAGMDTTPARPTGNLALAYQGDTPNALHLNNAGAAALGGSYVLPGLPAGLLW